MILSQSWTYPNVHSTLVWVVYFEQREKKKHLCVDFLFFVSSTYQCSLFCVSKLSKNNTPTLILYIYYTHIYIVVYDGIRRKMCICCTFLYLHISQRNHCLWSLRIFLIYGVRCVYKTPHMKLRRLFFYRASSRCMTLYILCIYGWCI